MKNINVTFDDDEMRQLEEIKGDLTWRELILTLIRSKE